MDFDKVIPMQFATRESCFYSFDYIKPVNEYYNVIDKKFKIKDPLFDRTLAYAKRSSMIDLLDQKIGLNNELYAQWVPYNFKCWQDGVTK